ncbi:MAG: hypothetical protein GXO10_01335 [Crenarchaeota archaeon]|nr:hypothetical protein [Thermoproteota archaeon]
MITIDLEKIANEIGILQQKHADKLIIIRDTVIIIEETGNIHTRDDVEKIVNTINELINGRLREYLSSRVEISNIVHIVGIIHSTGSSKGKSVHYIASVNRELQKRYRSYSIALLSPASCDRDLVNKLRKLNIEIG